MSIMRKPEMEVIRFKEADVIVASGFGLKNGDIIGIYVGNTGDKPADGSVTVNGTTHNMSGQNWESFYNSVLNDVGPNALNANMDDYVPFGGTGTFTFRELLQTEFTRGVSNLDWTGTYLYNGSSFKKQ